MMKKNMLATALLASFAGAVTPAQAHTRYPVSVVIDRANVWHLGDTAMHGWPALHGRQKTWSFTVADPHRGYWLKMQVLATDSDHNEVFINGKWAGHIVKNASDHDYVEAKIYVPGNLLQHGINRLEVQSAWLGSNNGGYDDFLLTNIHLDGV